MLVIVTSSFLFGGDREIFLLATTETEDQMQGGLLLDVVVREGAAILELFAGKDQPLLIWGNALLILNFGLDIFNGV